MELDASPLGVNFNGSGLFTALSKKRYWRVVQAGRFALSRRALPGWAWEILIGHMTFCGLVCRDVLSAFHSIYAFMRKHYNQRVPLWASAREEVEHFLGAMLFLRSDWWLPWSTHVTATDASLFGYGICTAE